mmetsp:Transcript_22662/g.40930  ORF Transcript_22662/g.40930 Transcript_22662/m.40930 type:complete len:206 (+) Transcript_22662:1100-1717(+)
MDLGLPFGPPVATEAISVTIGTRALLQDLTKKDIPVVSTRATATNILQILPYLDMAMIEIIVTKRLRRGRCHHRLLVVVVALTKVQVNQKNEHLRSLRLPVMTVKRRRWHPIRENHRLVFSTAMSRVQDLHPAMVLLLWWLSHPAWNVSTTKIAPPPMQPEVLITTTAETIPHSTISLMITIRVHQVAAVDHPPLSLAFLRVDIS